MTKSLFGGRDEANEIGFPDSLYEADGYPIIPVVEGPADTDADGMADTWEKRYAERGEIEKFLPWKDQDGDGWTNLEEYLNKTDPKTGEDPMDPNASPHVEGPLTP